MKGTIEQERAKLRESTRSEERHMTTITAEALDLADAITPATTLTELFGRSKEIELEVLRRDLLAAAHTMGTQEVRYLVDTYYAMQKFRVHAENQRDAQAKTGEPSMSILFVAGRFKALERVIRTVLGTWAAERVAGRWLQSLMGIGPVLSAGFLAHIDITQCPTAGTLWRFAGLDPSNKWLSKAEILKIVKPTQTVLTDDQVIQIAADTGRQLESLRRLGRNKAGNITGVSMTAALARRPWNGRLKVLCWKAGECFVHVSNNDQDFYGHLYAARKVREIRKNEAGDFADQAAAALKAKRYSHDTAAYKAYSQGKLPDAHIHARAKRYAVKLLLAHLHQVLYESEYGKPPPKPYILANPAVDPTGVPHEHWIAPPNWPMQ